MKSARAGIVAAGAAIAAAGFTAGKKWDDATKTIVAGTGATGDALKGLQADYQAVAKYGDGAATVIADLNTHLGLEGEALQMVAEAALKAKVDTNLFGDVSAQLGLDAEGAAGFLDQLTVASQGTGVDIDILTRTIGKSSARWQAAGGDMDDLAATVIKAADEFGPSGLRGAMSEIMQEVDKGLIPSVASLETQLGDTTGAVERTYEASKTWRDTLRETKDAALAYIGPAGDMIGALGSTASGLALAGPQMLKWIKGIKIGTIAQKAFNIVMRLNPIGLIVTAITLVGLAIYKWRDQIFGFLKGAWNTLISGLETGYNFIARLVPGMEEVSFASKMSFEPAVEAAAEVTEDLALEAETASAALSGGGDSLVASLEDTAKAAEDAAEEMRLAKRKFFHDAVIDRNKAKVAALKIEQEEAAAVAVVLEARRLQKRQFIHDAVIARNEAKVETLKIEVEEAAAALEAGKTSGTEFLNGITSTITPDRITGIFTAAFTGGGGVLGALKAIGTQLAGSFAKHFLTPFSSALSSGLAGIFGGGGAAAVAGVGGASSAAGAAGAAGGIGGIGAIGGVLGAIPVWGWVALGGLAAFAFFKGWGGPSKAEQEARATFAGFHKGVVDALGGTQRYADEVQVAINAGWDRTLAETRAGFILMGTDMGKTYDQAFADYERYQHAVKAGNTELMAQIEAEYADWRAASEETTKAVVHDADEIGRQFKGLTADEAAELGDALIGLGSKANQAFTDMHDSPCLGDLGMPLETSFLPQILAVSSAISNMPKDITIRITTVSSRRDEKYPSAPARRSCERWESVRRGRRWEARDFRAWAVRVRGAEQRHSHR